MSNIKGFIFDLDGVIVDTAKYHFLAWRDMARSLGSDVSEEQNEQLKGVSRVESLKRILSWGNLEVSAEKFEELMKTKNEQYLSYIHKMDASETLVDVPRVLQYLREHKQKVSLGSASKNARPILEKINLIPHFDAIVDGNDVSRAKPDPEVFLVAAERLSVNPVDCIVFEDSVAGVEAANNAQMISIGIGDKAVLSDADYVFSDFSEMSNDFLHSIIIK